MFALSAHADDLQAAVTHLTAIPNSIGVLTTSLFKGVQLSIASYPKATCLPFRSTIPGIPQAQVGRIRTYRPPSREDQASETRLGYMLAGGSVDWNDALSESGPLELPSDLQHIRDKSSVSSFFYLSDGRPEGLFDSLHRHFPAASQLGLIGSSTPFITGRPFTLFGGTSIFSDGAVGIALLGQPATSTDINFDNIYALSEPMEVTQAQTNLIETLDKGNPVESLMMAMKATGGVRKDQDIYLGTINDFTPNRKAYDSGVRTYNYNRLYKITAGGPSRGSLLLDATEGPRAGTKVQFATVSPSRKSTSALNLSDPVLPTISLNVLDESQAQNPSIDTDIHIVDKRFVGTSENGFVLKPSVGSSQERPWAAVIDQRC
ncbi:hypothetical protein RSOLAG1IB_01569 [Rhizoctonia solani AG-1 IB]|uniref:Uncharacterized protein n=1 Tax=Thanatephorus cucumeris (strain AG1-IB / isolate 7/3/14) TaxID=1108050 RepID=A0A0B7FHB7_THACB|nr:hypothetical protein RSOLAG1IB_01569 [Rhizoctonia solani AG-1 IB]